MTDLPPWPRDDAPPAPDGLVSSPLSVTCASCRRSVSPKFGALGAECPLCGGFLPGVTKPKRRTTPPATAPMAEADVAGEVADALLEEYVPAMSTLAEVEALYAAATDVVAEAHVRDLDRAERAEHAKHWRRHPAITGSSW